MLNRPSIINDNAINRLPQMECNELLDEFPIVTETTKAFQHLSLGSDAIPTEKSSNARETYRVVLLHMEEGWLVVLRLNVPVNNFSVMSGRSHRFLGN